jgi:hypothetical protein
LFVQPGAHTLASSFPFQASAYGYGDFDAYGYTGSACTATSKNGTSLTILNRQLSASTGAKACISAQARDSSGTPLGGVGITFKATGVNASSQYTLTDATGRAQFCYTGAHSGSDSVTADAIDVQDTGTVTWNNSGPNQAPLVSAGPDQTLLQPSNSVLLEGTVSDDGLPSGGNITIEWSKVSGPGTVSFSAQSQAQSYATFSGLNEMTVAIVNVARDATILIGRGRTAAHRVEAALRCRIVGISRLRQSIVTVVYV